jgi:hypothetical protein
MASPQIQHYPEVMRTIGPTGETAAPGFQQHKHRRGLFPVKSGVTIEHWLTSIELPIEPAADSTIVHPMAQGRRRGLKVAERFVMGHNPLDVPLGGPLPPNHPRAKGSPMVAAIKAGFPVLADVVDGTRDEFLEGPAAAHAKFACLHRECRGKRWDTPDELRRAHATGQELREAFQAHAYYGCCEVPAVTGHAATPGKRDDKGKWIEEPKPAVEGESAYLVLFSTEPTDG